MPHYIFISEDISSLSAILLNDDYYDFLKNGTDIVEGISILNTEHIIPFKVKAWLDLSDRKKVANEGDSKDIRKHKNDVFRLATLLIPSENISLPESIRKDMEVFFNRMTEEDINLQDLGIRGIDKNHLL